MLIADMFLIDTSPSITCFLGKKKKKQRRNF